MRNGKKGLTPMVGKIAKGKGKRLRRTGRPNGRPSEYTDAKAAEICRRIGEGQSIRTICRAPGMPRITALFEWLDRHSEFEKQYVRAKAAQADNHVEEMLDVARKAEKATSSEQAQGYRLLVDTLKWRASKMKAKSYGEKLVLEGELNLRNMTDDELNARIASLVACQSKAL